MISKKQRLTVSLFEKTFKKARRIKIGSFLFLVSRGHSHSRFGVVVGKKITKKAVQRNRIRRQTYEIIRTHPSRPLRPWNIIFLYKSGKIFQDSEGFKNAFQQLVLLLNQSKTSSSYAKR